MTVIGVTGGFCTGKTTVCAFFRDLGAHMIDADKIVHQLYKKDKKIKRAILKNFGKEVFALGKIDRTKLAKAIFGSKGSLRKLCNIVHPKVIKKIKEEIKKRKKSSATVIDAPLLIEAYLHKAVDYVVVVKVARPRQIERCIQRGFTKRNFLVRSALQMPLREKIKYADFVINNNGSKKYTRNEVIKVWKEIFRR